MNGERSTLWRKLLILPPIVVAILVLGWLLASKEPPAMVERQEVSRSVRIVEAQLIDLITKAEGYGPAQPARVWAAVAQVAGRVTKIHPKLRNGEILPQGELLLTIDATDYELQLHQAQAELAELKVREANAQASLAIEERNLKLASQDVERKRQLAKKGTTSQSSVDEAERVMLNTRSGVQNLSNTLSLIPAQRRVLEAKASIAQRNLERTQIRAPFVMRVAELAVEADQYVGVGQKLFEGDDVSRVEIEARFALSNLSRLFIGRTGLNIDVTRITEQVPAAMGLDPLVRLDLGNEVAEWQAKFVRFSDYVDPKTRTMGVVVAVDRPFEKVRPGRRPPLSKGMFLQVILYAKSAEPRLVIPRSAVRNNTVYVADKENRLRQKPVEVLFSQESFSVIASGLESGDRVVVSDPIPAVLGMLLRPQNDAEMTRQLQAAGTGK